MAAKSLISIWGEMVQKLSAHLSVFEMRWFSWFRNYHRTHQLLRRDKGRLECIFWKLNWNFILDLLKNLSPRLFLLFLNHFHWKHHLRQSVFVVLMTHYGIRSLMWLLKFSPDKVWDHFFYWILYSLSTTLYSNRLTCLDSDVWAYLN